MPPHGHAAVLDLVACLDLSTSSSRRHRNLQYLTTEILDYPQSHVHPALTQKVRSLPRLPSSHGMIRLVLFCAQSRVLSASEGLRWQAGGTPDENDEETRAAVIRQCRLSSVVVVKETRLAEVRSPHNFLCICVFIGVFVPECILLP